MVLTWVIQTPLPIGLVLILLMKQQTGLNKTDPQTGGNVIEKITPETYEKMNEEFEEEGLAFRIIVPTQEQIDEWRDK